MTSSKYSITAVNRITGKSRTTIIKHIKQGKLSYELDADGNKLIDAAELIRVYGDQYNFAQEERRQVKSPDPDPAPGGSSPDGDQIQARLDREIAERTREREQYREQVEHLQAALKLAQEGHNRATLLLENQSKGAGDWEQGLKRLEDRLAQQEQRMQTEIKEVKENASRKIAQYKRALEEERKALEEEREKGWWKRLWGTE